MYKYVLFVPLATLLFAMFQEILPKISAFISENFGSNCFLLKGEKETALIDSSSNENKEAVISGLSRLNLKPKDISLILHTHGHADHFGLDKLFSKARIAMHALDAEQINNGNQEFACTQFFSGTKMPRVSLFLEDNQEVDFGGLSLKVVHSPGHTPGSIYFFLREEKALFSGDTVFKEGFGRTDLSGGNPQKMAESLKKLQKLPFAALFPGHGNVLLGEEENRTSLKRTLEIATTNAFL